MSRLKKRPRSLSVADDFEAKRLKKEERTESPGDAETLDAIRSELSVVIKVLRASDDVIRLLNESIRLHRMLHLPDQRNTVIHCHYCQYVLFQADSVLINGKHACLDCTAKLNQITDSD